MTEHAGTRDRYRSCVRDFAAALPAGGALDTLSGRFGPVTVEDLIVSRSLLASRHSDVFVDRWVHDRLAHSKLSTVPRSLKRLRHWQIDRRSGNIGHDSGRFFTITGVQVRHRTRDAETLWDQPIIDQPEFGILGIVVAYLDGVLHFCLRLKEEPGNINALQFSPTVQATYSNYTLSHGGSPPPFIAQFLAPPADRVVLSKLQTEDGGRFLFKSNRNMIVLADEQDISPLPDDFLWLTLRQIAGLLRRDNIVNSCTRSVLASLI